MQQLNRKDNYPYNYFSNGLHISSEICLPELTIEETPSTATVTISWGEVPDHLDDVIFHRPVCQISETGFLLDIKNVAKYLVKGDNTVIIQPYEGVTEQVIRMYILSTILGVLLHKNNIFSLHASSVKINNKAVLLSGNSGAGKSTLALGLYKKGYEIFNDDISSVYFDTGNELKVFPGVVHLKLWADAIEKYGHDTSEFNRLRAELEKYSFPIRRTATENPAVQAIFFLSTKRETTLRHERIDGLKAFEKLRRNTFRYKLLKELKKDIPHFRSCSEILQKVPLFIFYRPRNISPAIFADYVEAQILEL